MALRTREQLCGPCSSTASLWVDVQGWWVHWWTRAITSPPGLERAKQKSTLACKGLLANCLLPTKEIKQASVFSSQKDPPPPFFFFLLGSSNWELVHPCTSCADPCTLCTALGTELPTLILHVPASAAHAPPNQSPRAGLLPCEWKVVFEQWFRALVWIVLPTCRQNRAQTNLVSRHSVPIFYFFFFIWKLLRKLFLLLLFVCFHKKWLLVLEFLYEKLSFNRSLFSTVLLVHCQPFHSCNSTIIHDLVDFQPQQLTVRTLNLEFQEWHSATSQV